MADPSSLPPAVLSLHRDGTTVDLGPVDAELVCDLDLLDSLLRFEVAARRLGWTLQLHDVRSELRELFALVGLADRVDRALD